MRRVKRMKKMSISLLVIMMISLLAGNVAVFADDTINLSGSESVDVTPIKEKDSAENSFLVETSTTGEDYQQDVYWFGNTNSMNDITIGNDLIGAGYMLTVNQAVIKGSIRTCTYDLSLRGVDVAHNMTVAGNRLYFDDETKAKGIYAAGNDIVFNGECDSINAGGNTIVLNGIVNGDARIDGSEITIGSDAVVTGKLIVYGAYEPEIPEGAKINSFEYHDSPNIPDEDTVETVSKGAEFVHKIFNRVYWIPAMIIVALFFCLVMPGAVSGSGKMLVTRPVAMSVSGLVALFAIPLAFIFLCVTIIGLPLAGLVALLYATMLIFAVPFAGASAGRLVFPKMNVWLSSIIGVAILTFALAIPFIEDLVKFLSMLYILGYFIQKCYEQIKTLGKKPETPSDKQATVVSETDAS